MRKPLIMLGLIIATAAVPAAAQLLSEGVDGRHRRCIYAPAAGNYLSDGSGQREHRVALAENCPATFPAPRSDLAPPPTAQLRQARRFGSALSCVYEQGTSDWTIPAPPSGICPLHAGIGQNRRDGRP